MKPLLITLTLCLSLASHSIAHSRELIVAVSPYTDSAAATAQAKNILKFLTELEPGDHATLIDGYNLNLLGEFTVPDDPKYRSPKARLTINRQAVSALLGFAKASQAQGNTGEPYPSVSGALRFPQLMRYIGENFATSEATDVVVIGSPLYEDRDTPALSMTDERFPGDGHLYRSVGETPYGATGNPSLLTNLNIHVAYGEGLPGSERHDHAVTRYWTLFAQQQGGTLSRFVRDLPTLLRQVIRQAPPVKHDYSPERSDKLEIIRLAPVEMMQSIYERPVTTDPLPVAIARRAEQVQVGISWACNTCDLDLYAQPHPGAALLYYGNTQTPQGHYWKDYTQSPKATNGQETIAFSVSLDLRALRLALNFYSGSDAGGAKGEIRLSVDGKTYALPFHIQATQGNGGAGVSEVIEAGKSNSQHTLLIDPLSIVGLR